MAELHTVKITIDAKFQNGLPFDGVLRLRLSRAVNVADGGGVVVPREWQEVQIRADKPETAEVDLIPNALLGEGTFYHYELVQVCNTGAYQYDRYGKRRTAEKGAIVVPDRDCDISELITLPPTDETRETAEAFASEAKQAAADARKIAEDLADTAGMAEVAFSGDYNDLKNTPEIPKPQDLTPYAKTDDVNTAIESVESDINGIQSIIPETASADNKLADKRFVNLALQTNTAYFRGDWATWADVPNNPSLYPADVHGNRTPTANDYMIIVADELQNGGTWRYKYTGIWSEQGKDGWNAEYQINESPFTQDQLAAVNSGITKEAVAKINKTEKAAADALAKANAAQKSADDKIPLYDFADAVITDGVLTIAPYKVTTLVSDGSSFTVKVGEEPNGKVRDCLLIVDCTNTDTAPTITWEKGIRPRTDAATDMECVAGVRNVFWLSKYAPASFVVAGWAEQEEAAQ